MLFSVTEIKQKKAKLSKNKRNTEKLQALLQAPFNTKRCPQKRKATIQCDNDAEQPLKSSVSFQESIKHLVTQNIVKENCRLQARNCELEQEVATLKEQVSKLKTQNQELSSKLQRLAPKHVNQLLKRKDASIKLWKSKRSSPPVNTKEKGNVTEVRRLKAAKKRQHQRHLKVRRKWHLQDSLNQVNIHSLDKQHSMLKEKEEEILFLENELTGAMDPGSATQVSTLVDGKAYSHNIKEASYHLQNAGVAQQNISKVMKNVAEAVTGVELVGPLPSYSTQNLATKEMKAVSLQHAKEVIKDSSNTTIFYDGTTKRVGHLVDTFVATDKCTMMVGMLQQVGGTATEYASTITEALRHVKDTDLPAGKEPLDIFGGASNTMSDRCITNAAVDKKLEAIKGGRLNQFKCGMHPLDACAKECEKTVKGYEQRMNIGAEKAKGVYPFQHRGESIAQSLVRVSAKIFHDTQYSCGEELAAFVRQRGAVEDDTGVDSKQIMYYRFIGNRFHIYFLCSGLLYHYTDALNEFFTTVQRPSNQIQQSVFNGLQLQGISPVLRSLGLLGKVLTGSWMWMLSRQGSILDLKTHSMMKPSPEGVPGPETPRL